MTDKQPENRDEAEHEDRSAWLTPQVRRLNAGEAEAAAGVGPDAAIFS